MKLYVLNKNKEKVYLSVVASSRGELSQLLGSSYFQLLGQNYTVNEVFAETSPDANTKIGVLAGLIVGLFAGGIGALVGGVAGGVIGNSQDLSEQQKVNNFNQKFLPLNHIH